MYADLPSDLSMGSVQSDWIGTSFQLVLRGYYSQPDPKGGSRQVAKPTFAGPVAKGESPLCLGWHMQGLRLGGTPPKGGLVYISPLYQYVPENQTHQ